MLKKRCFLKPLKVLIMLMQIDFNKSNVALFSHYYQISEK